MAGNIFHSSFLLYHDHDKESRKSHSFLVVDYIAEFLLVARMNLIVLLINLRGAKR